MRFFLFTCLFALFGLSATAQEAIAEKDIAELREELAEADEASSETRKRRAYKGVVRDGERLLKSAAEAPNRWQVLETVFQSQKRLFALENSTSNRRDLLDICTQLTKAPDEAADLRLEADLLLSEHDLSERNATLDQRAAALEALIARYRDTPGEARSLMIASQIAPKLEAFELEMRILRTMQDRFADHHGIIEFRRKSLAAGRIEALFRGTFTRADDGRAITFPIDRLGHPALVVFWSKDTQGVDTALKQIDEHRATHPGRFDYFSFNLDQLDDAGASELKALGLESWTVMRLPDGKKNQTFRTFGQREPVSILVNAYGYTLLTPNNTYSRGHGGTAVNPYHIEDTRITSERYLAQLQSLFIGDFLVTTETEPPKSMAAIQDCFVRPPFRYRLTSEQALANYRKAGKLCANAKGEPSPALRNRHIIALLGQWKYSADETHLEQAVALSRTALEASAPAPEAAVVPRFCLAKAALRASDQDAEVILAELVEAGGGARALAAACILALDANSRPLHDHYRERLLAEHPDDPAVWPVTSFLRDRFHTLDLLKVKLTRGERRIRSQYGDFTSPRGHCINHGINVMTNRMPTVELNTLDGKPLMLPRAADDKLTLLLFVEPPADPDAAFPPKLSGPPPVGKKKPQPGVMQYAFEMAERHVHQELEVIAAFLSDDAERVRSIMATNQWPCQAVLVPGGLENPMVRQLGIVSADRLPNVFYLRRDGTIAWHTSGFFYKSDFGYPFAVRLAMKVHTEVCDTELAFRALAAGQHKEAARVFSGPFLPEKDERYAWRAPRFHGRALALAGLKDWKAALADIDTAIEAHRKQTDHPEGICCARLVVMHRLKADILTQLGRAAEAETLKADADEPQPSASPNLYEQFHLRVESLRENHEK